MNKILVNVAATLLATLWQTPLHAQLQKPAPRAANRAGYISVVDFGANGQDNRWDTDAIQKAIDSLPRPTMPRGKDPCGGVILLPAGRYHVNKPLRITNGITLRGEGAGTVIHMHADAPAIELFSPFDHHYVANTVVEDLCVYTETSPAIAPAADVGNVVQCRFENLILGTGGTAIDLDPQLARKTYTQNTVLRNIHVVTPGGAALTLYGNANQIHQINSEWGTREKFKAEPAMVTISGSGNDIRYCIIEGNAPNPVAAFHISDGSFTWGSNWVELIPKPADGVAYIFKNIEMGQIDYLHEILPVEQARFINCANVRIAALDVSGDHVGLMKCLDIDEASSIHIDHVTARYDAGGLDEARVSIGSIYNKTSNQRLSLPLPGEPLSLMVQPWSARWTEPLGTIKGTMSVEDAAKGIKKLRVEITENPQKRTLFVELALQVPDALAGKSAAISYRVEGPGQFVAYYAGEELPARVMGSKGACLLPAPLKSGELLQFVLPPEPGVYYISEVAVHAKSTAETVRGR